MGKGSTDTPRNLAFLSLGSNIEPEENLPAAARELARYGLVLKASRVWETRPLGTLSQPRFLNAVLLLETRLSAHDLKEIAIAAIESRLGRVRSADRNAPRTIDIDIMLFNRDRIVDGRHRIPHPEVLERPFVAIPLAEIAPDYIHPETGETLRQIARRFDRDAAEMRLRDDVVLPLGRVEGT